MNAETDADDYIDRLLEDPKGFTNRGDSYELLQEFFKGSPVEKLVPLLRHEEYHVRRNAVWVASELGEDASELVPHVTPLTTSEDRFVRLSAMDVLIACGSEYPEELVHVFESLTSEDQLVREHAMTLAANMCRNATNPSEILESTLEVFRNRNESVHAEGLEFVIEAPEMGEEDIQKLLKDPRPLIRRYAAIAAARKLDDVPHLLADMLESDDVDIRKVARQLQRVEELEPPADR